jgi:hypothetical protein
MLLLQMLNAAPLFSGTYAHRTGDGSGWVETGSSFSDGMRVWNLKRVEELYAWVFLRAHTSSAAEPASVRNGVSDVRVLGTLVRPVHASSGADASHFHSATGRTRLCCACTLMYAMAAAEMKWSMYLANIDRADASAQAFQ